MKSIAIARDIDIDHAHAHVRAGAARAYQDKCSYRGYTDAHIFQFCRNPGLWQWSMHAVVDGRVKDSRISEGIQYD
jgi:hypothetical protein